MPGSSVAAQKTTDGVDPRVNEGAQEPRLLPIAPRGSGSGVRGGVFLAGFLGQAAAGHGEQDYLGQNHICETCGFSVTGKPMAFGSIYII